VLLPLINLKVSLPVFTLAVTLPVDIRFDGDELPPPFAANRAYDAVVAKEAVPCNGPVKDPDKLKG
jgi:hypothetical protein